jgi:hypothetical protein
MKWSELSSEQRNRLVATEVMGWQAKECDGEIGEQPISPDGWYCLRCGYDGSWGDGMTHEENPPRYSESMDRACTIPQHPRFFEANTSIVCVPQSYWKCEMDFHQKGTVYYAFADVPAEAVCLVALKAVGISIDEG